MLNSSWYAVWSVRVKEHVCLWLVLHLNTASGIYLISLWASKQQICPCLTYTVYFFYNSRLEKKNPLVYSQKMMAEGLPRSGIRVQENGAVRSPPWTTTPFAYSTGIISHTLNNPVLTASHYQVSMALYWNTVWQHPECQFLVFIHKPKYRTN